MSDSLTNNNEINSKPASAWLYLFIAPFILLLFVSLYTLLFHSVSPVSRDLWFIYQAFIEIPGWVEAALTPFSNHLTIIPNLLFYADFSLFNASNTLLLIISFWCLALISLFAFRAIEKDKLTQYSRTIILCWVLYCLFLLNNFALLGWAFIGTQHYLMFAFLLLAASIYQSNKLFEPTATLKQATPVALFLVLATFCFGGFLAFPAIIACHLFFRGNKNILLFFIAVLVCCLLFYFGMTGSNALSGNTTFSLKHALAFYFSLIGSPVFYLLRSFTLLNQEYLKIFCLILGFIFFVVSSYSLINRYRSKQAFSPLDFFLLLFIFIGLGAPLVIILFRSPVFWDPFVDRYQIWASCFYIGFPFFIKRILINNKSLFTTLFSLLLIISIPSQVQLSQRVIDYRQNVERGLIDYHNGFLDDKAQREVLHFGWEYKQNTFLKVFSYIDSLNKNFFVSFQPHHKISLESVKACDQNLVLIKKPSDEISLAKNQTTLGQQATRFFIHLKGGWDYVYLLDDDFNIIGSGKKLNNSLLPRNLLKWKWSTFNGYASAINGADVKKLVFTDKQNKRGCYTTP